MAQIQPTFAEPVPFVGQTVGGDGGSGSIKTTCDGKLEDIDPSDDYNYTYKYIFIADRSFSMYDHNRMKITKDAMVLFL